MTNLGTDVFIIVKNEVKVNLFYLYSQNEIINNIHAINWNELGHISFLVFFLTQTYTFTGLVNYKSIPYGRYLEMLDGVEFT